MRHIKMDQKRTKKCVVHVVYLCWILSSNKSFTEVPGIGSNSVDGHDLREVDIPAGSTNLDLGQRIVGKYSNTLGLLACFAAFRRTSDLPVETHTTRHECGVT